MVNIKNGENKIKYSCPLCLKEFGNKKSNYQNHINKTGCGVGIKNLRITRYSKDMEWWNMAIKKYVNNRPDHR